MAGGEQEQVLAVRREAASRAAAEVRPGMVVGLGTGATASLAVEEIGRRLRAGELSGLRGIPTSRRTEELARRLGIPLTDLEAEPRVDLTIDGADEVDPAGNLLKGGGGALLREKVVALASRRLLIVVDPAKQVARLGEKCALPFAVVPFGWSTHARALEALGGSPALRRGPGGEPFLTDDGLLVLDCRFPGGIDDPRHVERVIASRPGVAASGLFLGFSPEVIVGHGTDGGEPRSRGGHGGSTEDPP